jgi:FHS family L-fucose permease-like MFS transporter
MIPCKISQKKIPAAIIVAFFTIGLFEALFPRLNRHINFVMLDNYYISALAFAGLLAMALLPVLFSMIRQGKDSRMKLALALIIILPGLLIPLVYLKSSNILLFSALFLFAGSLLVQAEGLRVILSTGDKGIYAKKMAILYLFNSAGLIMGMAVTAIAKDWINESYKLLYISIVFLVLSLACLFIFPYPAAGEDPREQGKYGIRALLSNKFVILMLGGLAVYAGTEFCMVDFLPFYFSETFGTRIMQMVIPGIGLFMVSFFTGRLAGVFLLERIKAENLFLISGILGILGLSSMFVGQKDLSLIATVMTGLGTANILPLMLSLSLDRLKGGNWLMSGMMIGTIPLGAFFPSLMWAVADSISLGMSFTVPVFCLFYLTWIAILLIRRI